MTDLHEIYKRAVKSVTKYNMEKPSDVYKIYGKDKTTLLAIFGNLSDSPKGLDFKTKSEDFIQVATFNYERGHEMKAHRHIKRTPPEIFRSEEMLLLWKGAAWCDIYDIDGFKLIAKGLEKSGDYVIVLNGGVGYQITEDDTIMIECKTGPFTNSEEDRVLL